MLLVMSVHTGFGGQPFIPEVLDKGEPCRTRSMPTGWRARSRSTVASRSRTRTSRPKPGSTSLLPARASSVPRIRSWPRAIRDAGDAARAVRPMSLPDERPMVGPMSHAAKVLTVSDGVAAARGEDKSGDALVERLEAGGFTVAGRPASPPMVSSPSPRRSSR